MKIFICKYSFPNISVGNNKKHEEVMIHEVVA